MRPTRPAVLLAACLLAGSTALTACGDPAPAPADGKPQVVTTVAPLTSIVASVVGDRADVHGLVPEGTNSHTFDPPPSAGRVLGEADVVFLNGLQLEEPTKKLAESTKRADARIVELGPAVLPERDYIYDFSFPKEEGKPNPHLWTDPTYAVKYADTVRDTMIQLDPGNAATYRRNAEAFDRKANALAGALRADQRSIPEDRRELLTYHDAYAYFARTFGWKVVGAIQPKNFEDPTPQEIAGLIEQVKRDKVTAIFGSEVFPSKVLEQIGAATGVRYVDVLRDDDLPGSPGAPEHSWLGLMRFDYVTIVESLGGTAPALKALDTHEDTVSHADYPQ
ncbi:metal ABC transporter substrate-binding protein [Amycolatopsis sp. NPDC021455]|uniref:metal ABC transporter substrate-binding protein n=1 Tax=Amycolatopsis sp. NPDC021455 TaxID=3154901 RepID=UPI0033D02F0F